MNVFRPARPAGPARNLCRTLAQIVVFWGFFLGVLPALLLWLEDRLAVPQFPGWPWLGTAAFAAASLAGLWSAWTMAWEGEGTPLPTDCPRRLVLGGPYAWLRNPMATAGISQGLAIGIGFGSWSILLYSLCGAIGWHWLVRPAEEEDLRNRFGSDYEEYRRQVPLWIPRIPR